MPPEIVAAAIAAVVALLTSGFAQLALWRRTRQAEAAQLRREVLEAFRIARERAEPTERAIARLWSLLQEAKRQSDASIAHKGARAREALSALEATSSDVSIWHTRSGAVLDEALRSIWHGAKNIVGAVVDVATRYQASGDPGDQELIESYRASLTESQGALLDYRQRVSKQFTDEILALLAEKTT